MIAEILSTGDEIRSGALIDTNGAYLADLLESSGVTVTRHTSVGDDMETLIAAFHEIGRRADIALVTGGLGPTVDDLSAEAAAKAAGVRQTLNEEALAAVSAYFESRNRVMPVSNRKQAMLPEGSEMLPNLVGTASGFAVTIGRCRFFFMPGVPHEMRRMAADQVLPRVMAMMGDDRPVHRIKTIASFGLPESKTGEMVGDVTKYFPDLKLGLRAKFPEIQVKLYAEGHDADALDRRLDAATDWVCRQLGNKVFSTDGEPMEAVVGKMLREKGATVAVAESCTGGLVSSMLTDVSGSSDYFLLGCVTYANAAKAKVLGVSPKTIGTYGAVSEETVREMAQGVREAGDATYGIATSGITGPTGGTPEKPVGTVCIGLAGPRGLFSARFLRTFVRRDMNKHIFAMIALDTLRRELAGILD